jgi:hypothetical protein
LPITAEAVQ